MESSETVAIMRRVVVLMRTWRGLGVRGWGQELWVEGQGQGQGQGQG